MRLILVEGLPASGKSTIAKIADKVLKRMGIETKLYLEGNLEHPADYDGVAYFNKEEFEQLLYKYSSFIKRIEKFVETKESCYLISYVKAKNSIEDLIPEEFFEEIAKRDIYEMPLELHIKLLTDKWKEFVKVAKNEDVTYIFDCCFIQNPITTSMIRSNSSKEKSFDYIKKLAEIVEECNPIIIYVNQRDIEASFMKVIDERPKEWLSFFINYSTTQGYGKANNLSGLKGTFEVLKARKELEREILGQLAIDKYIIDNSQYSIEGTTKEISDVLKCYYDTKDC
ncbi:hypothetical protein I5677_01850 [Mobilitalea sibirica]|uniref:Uncharacterized protein n=1 Tax=Mobilitalea sibirica TaxID=1462919 RepID=A0A8J7HBU6_9FIRM|nr:hypothetical protein [Mobilitalea sibirica]MBH1939634.1 hypothetical protein [Mobilitalea sibirica]